MSNDSIDGSKIFIWSQIGESLKSLDADRMLSLAESDSDYSLSRNANIELMKIIQRMKNGESIDTVLNETDIINKHDNLFREINAFLHDKPVDMLSVGSFIVGNVESKKAYFDLGDGEK